MAVDGDMDNEQDRAGATVETVVISSEIEATLTSMIGAEPLSVGGSIHPTFPLKDEGTDEMNWIGSFAPVSLRSLLSEPEESVPWVIEGYVAQGRLTLLAGPPKLGKTTLSYEAVAKVTTGQPFLEREVQQGKVLVLGLEEHRSDIRIRLQRLGGECLADWVTLQFAPFPYDVKTLEQLRLYVRQEGIAMVLIDTLPAWWQLFDENAAAEVIRKITPLLQCVRDTKAGWLAIAHTRKGGGQYGEEIRGSSALLGAVDISISMKREGNGTKRVLEAVSRFRNTPGELVIDFRDACYVCLGDAAVSCSQDKAEKVFDALTDEGQTSDDLVVKADMSKQDVSRGFALLGNRAKREGKGVKGDPYLYSRNTIRPTPNPKEEQVDELQLAPGYTRSVEEASCCVWGSAGECFRTFHH